MIVFSDGGREFSRYLKAWLNDKVNNDDGRDDSRHDLC